ncbi:MAG TPA: putative sulfate exporter family transporter [Desulfotomaculum sp.]|nr:MAG: membrane protein [Desulfotomaculum sp. BICA1-6]HBX23279.1 putative sulfate exporter family transporter [Desulfotomaculum sp.]
MRGVSKIKTLLYLIHLLPGILTMVAVAVVARGGADLGFPQWQGLESILAARPVTARYLVNILHLNYVLICIITGILLRNLIGIPPLLAPGITRTSRLFIKLGVILLGSLYSFRDLANLGSTAFVIILAFVIFTLTLTLYLGQRLGLDPAAASVLAAGTAICGVSAIVAVAPAVRAKSTDVAYSIATILGVGLFYLFMLPAIGTLLGLSPHQFGVWVGTGILNSGQVLAAALSFDPGTAEHASASLKTGEIYNLTRILFLPFVVLFLAVYCSRSGKGDGDGDGDGFGINTKLGTNFPLFVVGFLVVVFMTSFGMLGETTPPSPELVFIRRLYSWFFAIGLAGLGMQISFEELRRAGGSHLLVGITAATVKLVGALLVVLLLIAEHP